MSDARTTWAKRAAAVLVVAIACALGSLAVLHSAAFLGWARDAALSATNESLAGTLEIGRISGGPLTELVIEDVALRAPGGERVVHADLLRAEIALSALLGRGVVVALTAEGGEVFVRRTTDGETNLMQALASTSTDETTSALPVWLDLDITLTDFTVIWRDDAAAGSDDDPLQELTPTTPRTEVRDALAKVGSPSGPLRATPRTAVLDELSTRVRVVVARDQQTAVAIDEVSAVLGGHGFTAKRAVRVDDLRIDVPTSGATRLSVAEAALEGWLTVRDARVVVPENIEQLAASVGLQVSKELLDAVAPEAGIRVPVSVAAQMGPDDGGSRVRVRVEPLDHAPVTIAGRISRWAEPGPETTYRAVVLAPNVAAAELTTIPHPVRKLAAVLEVEGRGVDVDTMSATARVGVTDAEIDKYRIDAAYAEVAFADGKLVVRESYVTTPYGGVAGRVRWGMDGTFEVESRTEASEEVQKLAEALFQRSVRTTADVRIDARGALDLDAAAPSAMLRALEADVEWDVDSFVAEDVSVSRSIGKLRATLRTEGARTALEVRGNLSGRSVRAPGANVSAFDAEVDLQSRVTTADPTPMELVRGLRSRVDLDVRGLEADDAIVRDIDVLITTSPAGGKLRYEVRGSAARLNAGTVRARDVAAKLAGTVTPGDELAWPAAVRALEVRGEVAAQGVDASGDAASAITARVDVAGPIGNLKGKVGASTTGLQVGDYAFTSLDADVEFVGDRIFEVRANGTQKERKPEELGVYVKGRYNQQLDDFEVLELRFDSTGSAWSLTDGFSLDTSTGSLRFDDVTVTHDDQRIHVTGTIRQGKDQELAVEVDDLDLAAVARDFGLTQLEPVRGKVSAEAEVAGTAREPTARFRLHLRELYWHEYGPFELTAEGRYGELALVVEAFTFDGYGVRFAEGNATLPVRITTDGEFEVLESEKVEAWIETPELALQKLHAAVPRLAEWSVLGAVSQETRLRGTLANPRLNVDTRVDNVTAAAIVDADRLEVGPVNGTLTARYDNPRAENGGFELSLNATWADEPPIQLLARVQADVAAWLRETLDGRDVDWQARLQAAPWRFIGQAQRFDLANLRIGALREADIEGLLTLNVIGDGSLAAPKANVELKLQEFGWERYRDVFVDADLAIEKDRLVLKTSRLEWDADEILVASGTIPVPFETLFGDAPLGNVPIDFRAQLQPMKLAKLSAVDYTFAALKGTVRGFAQFNGTLTSPIIEAQLALDDVQFADRTTGAVTLNAALNQDDRMNAEARWSRQNATTLRATLTAPLDVDLMRLAAGEALDLSGEFDATLKADGVALAGLLPMRVLDETIRDVGGQLDLDMKVRGTIEGPRLDGRARVSDGKVTLTRFSRAFEDVQIDLTATEADGLALHDFHLAGERGYVDAQGSLQLAGWKPGRVDGEIEVREFGTAGFSEMPLFVWADVRLGGDFSANPASAKATISGVEVVVPDTADRETHATGLDEDIVIIRNDRDRELLFPDAGSIEPASSAPFLELAIEIEDGALIRHPLAEVEVGGDLALALSDAGPLLRGEIEAQRGTATFLGKRFTIQQALVTFTGNDPPDPSLQVEAAYQLDRALTRSIGQATSGEPRAIVRVTGRASDPRIRFLSDPSMAETDVIYVLMTNRPPGQGEVGETGLATGAASGLLSQLIADSPVGRVFDVRVEAGEQGFSDASIEVGRYIGRDVFISLDFKSGAQPNENTSELNIEYRFLPRWIFEFEAGDRATGEANIFWDIY